ncbi:MAG: hypothetical protein IT381_31505 [Deltaproteobacteria bacterium]|nr:hypothetical protein [Deltaproteobacteria bacterium]
MHFRARDDHSDVFGAPAAAGHERVLLAPPRVTQARLERGIRHALAEHGQTLRVVVRGATLQRRVLPEGLIEALTKAGATFTELDAYLPTERAPHVAAVTEGCRAFLAKTYNVPASLDAADVLWGSAMQRTLTEAFTAWLYVLGLAHFHRQDAIHCLDPRWPGLATLRERTEGRVEPSPRIPSRPAHFVRTLALFAVESASLVAARAKEHLEQRSILRAIPHTADPVRRWSTVITNAPHSSRHALTTLAAIARDHPVGLILLAPLKKKPPVDERPSGAALPPLAHPALQGLSPTIAQAVVARPLRHLSHTLFAATQSAFRLAWNGARLHLGPVALPLDRRRTQQLLRIATFDAQRLREARAATERLCRRQNMKDAKVVFPHASLAAVAAVDRTLQAFGATTYELVHGALADPLDMVTHARSTTSVKLLWTRDEATMHARYVDHQRIEAPVVPAWTPIRHSLQHATRLLVLSNYAHPILGFDGPCPREPYQRALWHAVIDATADLGCELVWRPHPGDDRRAVDALLRTLPNVRRSTGTLDEDLAGADAVIATVSTTIVEALRAAHLAVFVHDIPFHERDVVMRLFDPARVFSSAAELKTKLTEHLAAPSTAPENALRRRFFGETQTPRTAAEVLR